MGSLNVHEQAADLPTQDRSRWLSFNRMQSIPSDMIEWWCGKPNHNPSPIFPEKTLSLKPSTHWTFGHRQFKKNTRPVEHRAAAEVKASD